ncbi:MAG: hypothetical protein A2231_02055 [Candidatus Firestonebacteria bacterium RIFOXYA2_FULL_40_8]|nr:MAG: hypothetical protein A2231_02055 [Candidatus Firestonebacteria bacterium RIFOXYA2_FULL_40_8]
MLKKAVMLSVVCCIAFFSFGCAKKLSKDEMIERGKYLVNACGVLAHHTPIGKDGKPDLNKFMAGSEVPYKGAWGVSYSKNLTPDNDTGIGMMTDEEVINMIKDEGINGKAPLYYDYYRGLTDEDLKSLVSYLRTLTPITNKIPADTKPGEAKVVEKKVEPKKAVTPAKKATTAKKTTTKKK